MDGRKFHMVYVKGSALYINNAGTFKLPDTIATTNGNNGTLIGDTKMDGNIPGCAEHAGFVILRVRPIYEQEDESPDMNTTSIKKHENTSWGQVLSVTMSEGSLIDVKVVFTNTSEKDAENVSLRADLSDGLSYVDGSLRFAGSGDSGNIANLNPTVGDGVITGSYKPGEAVTLEYQVTIDSDIEVTDLKVSNEVSFSDSSGNTQRNMSRAFISKASADSPIAPIEIPESAAPRAAAAEWATIIQSPFVILGELTAVVVGIVAFLRFLKKRKEKKGADDAAGNGKEI
jgi:uncharacterized repeat protein (TIGR01451 family)